MTDDDGDYLIEGSLGSLSLRVQGDDEDWVDDRFDEKLEKMLSEGEEMSKAVRDGSRGCV